MKALLADLLIGLMTCAAPLEAMGEELGRLQALMSCLEEPAPTPVLQSLSSAGLLGERSGPGDDDDYCWPLATPLDWSGATFTSLCVVTDDSEAMASHPEFYWEGALAPWTEVWLISAVPADHLKAWASRTLPPASRFEIDRLQGEYSHSALSCSEWHFPLPGLGNKITS